MYGNDRTLHRDRWSGPIQWIGTNPPMGTMFSFARHMVPEICGFKGDAIYVDSDMLIFESMEQIMEIDMGQATVLGVQGSHQNAVQRMDCAALLKWTIGFLLRSNHSGNDLQRNAHLPKGAFQRRIPKGWNDLERRTPNTKLLHYTQMPTQPWVKPGHLHGDVWFEHLAEACASGFIGRGTVEEEIRTQDVRTTWPAAMYPQPHVLEELKVRL